METLADARSLDPSFPKAVVEAFVAATATAFEELTGSIVIAREPFVLDRPLALDVTATLVLRHEPPGLLLLTFPLAVLTDLASRYLGEAGPVSPELLDDAAGEFANVIAGQAKTMLKGTPEHFLLSTPIVSRAAVITSDHEFVTMFFDCDAGTFAVQIVHW